MSSSCVFGISLWDWMLCKVLSKDVLIRVFNGVFVPYCPHHTIFNRTVTWYWDCSRGWMRVKGEVIILLSTLGLSTPTFPFMAINCVSGASHIKFQTILTIIGAPLIIKLWSYLCSQQKQCFGRWCISSYLRQWNSTAFWQHGSGNSSNMKTAAAAVGRAAATISCNKSWLRQCKLWGIILNTNYKGMC